MQEMTLESASNNLEKLENDKKYWEDRLTQILSLVTPQSGNMEDLHVDGGEKLDKLLKFTELKDEMQIDSTLKYIDSKILSINTWIEGELKRLNKYGEVVKEVVYLKEKVFIKDRYTGKERHLTWKEIADRMHFSIRTVQYAYDRGIEKRRKDAENNYIYQ